MSEWMITSRKSLKIIIAVQVDRFIQISLFIGWVGLFRFLYLKKNWTHFVRINLFWRVPVFVSSAPTLLRLHLAVILCGVIQRRILTWGLPSVDLLAKCSGWHVHWATPTKYSVCISNIECAYSVIYLLWILKSEIGGGLSYERKIWLLLAVVSHNDLNVI